MDIQCELIKKVNYKNFAFISYSHEDMRWAKKIQNQLEEYRLPARLQKKYKDIPNRTFPIARDDTNIAGSKVWNAITKELDDSQFLIVICSPISAKSDWVNDEIEYFIETGKEANILPLIIGGIPNSGDAETECFPPALRKLVEDPLGVDVPKLGWRVARLRLVSSMLKVDFDELLRRDTHRRIQKGIMIGLLTAVLGAVLGWWIWYNTEHSKYYNAVTYQYEIPIGIYELSKEERAVMSDCYRITTLRNKVIRLETVNSFGVAVNPVVETFMTNYPIQEFLYDDDGELDSIILKDTTGLEITKKNIKINKEIGEGIVEFLSPSNDLKVQALSADMSSYLIGNNRIDKKSEITRQYNFYNSSGYLIRAMYQLNNVEDPACDSNGVYGKAFEYNEQCLISRISNLNEKGDIFNCKYGWAYSEMFYDRKGNMVLETNHNSEGKRVRNENGISAVQIEYDARMNAIVQKILDENDQLTYNKDGWAKIVLEYDDQGLKIAAMVFDMNDRKVYDRGGMHEIRFAYDAFGRCISQSCYNTVGEPIVAASKGWSSVRYVLDKCGRVIEERTYALDEKPCCNKENGAYGYRYSYNENGHHIRTDYLNADGSILINKLGYATWCVERNADGRILREEYRNEKGKLTRNNDNIAVVEYAYDKFGNVIELRFYDEKEELCCHTEGHSIIQRTYTSGRLVSERLYDSEQKPFLGKNYYYESKMEYDDQGNCVRWSCYDTDGNLIDASFGYAVLTKQYDIYGNVIEECYFAANEVPAYTLSGYKYHFKYDAYGNQILGVKYSDAPDLEAFSIVEAQYDTLGNLVLRRFYDEKGNPVTADRHPAQENMEYDWQGNLVRKESVYVSDRTVSEVKYMTYDEQSNLMLEQWFREDDTGNTCLYQTRYSYDKHSNRIRTNYLDGAGNPRMLEDGYASFTQGYTAQGDTAWIEYYDAAGNPGLYKGQTFRFEYAYDAGGNQIEMRCYDINRELLKEKNGIAAIVRYKHDVRGIRTYEGRFNEHDQPFSAEDGSFSYMKYELDEAGFIVGEIFYDKEGNVLSDNRFYVYAGEVYEGYSGYEMGVRPGQFIIQLGEWNYFEDHDFSSATELRPEVSRTMFTEKELVTCEWTAEDIFIFRRFQMPKGPMGIRIMSDTGDVKVLNRMKEAYNNWIANQNE